MFILCTADLRNVPNFAYSVRFFHESVVDGRVKQSPRTLQQELAGGKSFKLLQSPWRLLHSTTRHALIEKPNRPEYAQFEHSVNLLYHIITVHVLYLLLLI